MYSGDCHAHGNPDEYKGLFHGRLCLCFACQKAWLAHVWQAIHCGACTAHHDHTNSVFHVHSSHRCHMNWHRPISTRAVASSAQIPITISASAAKKRARHHQQQSLARRAATARILVQVEAPPKKKNRPRRCGGDCAWWTALVGVRIAHFARISLMD